MRKFLLSLVLLVIFCGISSADIVYTTEDGNLGLIRIYRNLSFDLPVVENSIAGSNPIVGAYRGDKEARVFLVDRTLDKTTSGDTLYVFETTNLVEPINSGDLDGIYNVDKAVFSNNGNSVFLLSGLVIYDYSTETLTERNSFDFELQTSNDIYVTEIKGIAVDDAIYVIADTVLSDDVLMQFDGQLKKDNRSFAIIESVEGTSDIAILSDTRLAVAHKGGVSQYRNGSFVTVVSSDYPVEKLCRDNDNGFFYITQRKSGNNYISTLSRYSERRATFSSLTLEGRNPNIQLVRDSNYETLAVIMDEKIMLYDMSTGLLIEDFDRYELGGVPLHMAACRADDSSGTKNSSSSGCEISLSGIILLLVCAGMIAKHKKTAQI